MRRRDPDELPPIDIVGTEPATSSVQHVSRGPGGPPRRHLRGILIAATVAGLLLAGLALGGDDSGGPPDREDAEEETTTTTRRRGSTTTRPPTTTTTVAVGPLFAGQDLGGWLLSGNTSGWTLVDMSSGAVLHPTIPFEDPYSTRAVTGGVTTMRGGQVEYHDLRVPEDVREPVMLGRADLVLRAVEPDQMWLLEGTYAPSPTGGYAHLVDLAGHELRSFSIPPSDYRAATSDGVLFQRGGRVFLADERGVHAVAIGDLVGAAGSSILVYSCDDDGSCGIELRRPSGQLVRRRLAVDVSAPQAGFEVWGDERGRFALVTYSSSGGSAVGLFQPDGTLDAIVDTEFGSVAGPLTWLPDDTGLVGTRNGRIVWIHSSGDGLVVEDIPGLGSIQSDGVLAISAT